nr:hypothetical protein [Oceanococcus sp. HetDA_MAG_MS8]
MNRLSRPFSAGAWLACALTLGACSESDSINPGNNALPAGNTAVVAARAADFSSGAHLLLDLDGGLNSAPLDPGSSDLRVIGDGSTLYRLARFGSNTLSRYTSDAPGVAEATFSTESAEEDTQSNPSLLVPAGPGLGYLLRYGSGALWVVNPQAATEADFFRSTIDLSGFDSDGVPQMSDAVIIGGRLWVALQRLNPNFAATQAGLLIAIDLADDRVVDLDPATAGTQGYTLPIRNPSTLIPTPDGQTLLVQGDGGFDGSFNPVYEGGIARVSLADGSSTLLVDDGTAEDNPRGQILGMARDARGQIWFTAGAAFGGSSLYRYDPDSEAITLSAVNATQQTQLSTLQLGPQGRLWVGSAGVDGSQPEILLLDTQTDSLLNRSPLDLVPINISFIQSASPQ